MDRSSLWAVFAAAFPGRPQGADERQWFNAALETLADRGLIRLPAKNGARWDRSMGVPIPTSIDLVRQPLVNRDDSWRSFPWHPRLHWIADLRSLADEQANFLRRVHAGLVAGSFTSRAPLKYRSLELTGDEKRLGKLMLSRLFGPGRLDTDLLGCLPEMLPLAWEEISDGPTMIVFENSGPFIVARNVLRQMTAPPYGLVGYGGGAGFELSVQYIKTIERPVERIEYVGDLDRNGLRIARSASLIARRDGLPSVAPAAGLHRAMVNACVRFGSPSGWPHPSATKGTSPEDQSLVEWLSSEVRSDVVHVLEAGHRIPEEVLGPEELLAVWRRDADR